jgi:hypothetical protein
LTLNLLDPLEASNQADLHDYLLFELQDQSISPLKEQAISFCLAVLELASHSLIPFSIDRLQLNRRGQYIIEGHYGWGDDFSVNRAQLIVTGFRFVLEEQQGPYLFLPHQLKVSHPNSTDVPFSTIMKLPLPFLKSSDENFSSCHLQTMTSQAFLVGDEWEGCYGRGQKIDELDASMRGVVFEHYKLDRIPLASLEARGTDLQGEFTLIGTINCVDGKLKFCKRYMNGQPWGCSGVMTPFGIVGNWTGRYLKTGYGGLFWLWKAKWTCGSS